MPVLHGLHWCSAPQDGLRQLRVVECDISHESLLQVEGAVEAVGFQHIGDAPVEALDHAVGLGRFRRGQPVLDAKLGAEMVELMVLRGGACPGRKEPIGELFSVIGQCFGDPDRAGPMQIAQEPSGIRGRLGGQDAHEHPPCRPVDGHVQVTPGRLVRHLWQILHVDMQEAGFVGLEGLARLWAGLGQQRLEIADAMPPQESAG